MNAPLLEARSVGKAFGAVTALQDVSLRLHAGEVLALIGENGAGKSTLMKVLAGIHPPDRGAVFLHGQQVVLATPRSALDAGIALIHQELELCANLTVAGALFLGRELCRGPFLQRAAMDRLEVQALKCLGLDVSPQRLVATLSPGQQQLLEIARALAANARVLIMDEPTSSLTAAETARLYDVVRELQQKGTAIVWITHRMAEVQALADRVAVLRDGRLVGELTRAEATPARMVAMMVGRPLDKGRQAPRVPGPRVLTVRALRTQAFPAAGIDLDLHRGEIVGIAGLLGSGRSELLRALFGADRALGGTIDCDGRWLRDHTPAAAARAGLVLVPEDRQRQGLVLGMTVRENLSLPTLRRRGVWLDAAWERQLCQRSIDELGIVTPGGEQRTALLSGGNQQKVVLGKWLAAAPKVLLLDEPTRGVDVGARAEIYARLHALAAQGLAVLFVSSELPEVLALADRVLVLHRGEIAGALPRAACDEATILRLMLGQGAA